VGYGGQTLETAGTLEVGSDNTFTVADATVDDYFDDQAWWTFTVTSPSRVDLTSSPHSTFALFDADVSLVVAIEADGSEAAGVTAYYLLPPGTYHLVVGVFGTPPVTYTITYAPRLTGSSPWNSDLRDDPTNVLTIVDLDSEDWDDVIRPGSFRTGEVTFQETLGGPWDTNAEACAIEHALWGNQIDEAWTGACPLTVVGLADFELLGGSDISHFYEEDTGFPFDADHTTTRVRTASWGIWLKPVEERLPVYGVLSPPNPVDYGYPPEAVVEYEGDVVELIGLKIGDRAGTLGVDPESRYAVNFDRQPGFLDGEWTAWDLGNLPGGPPPPEALPDWLDEDDPNPYVLAFSSEGVDDEDKTFHTLAIPADGFTSLTQDYLEDTYDYGVIAGPAEAFGIGSITAGSRSAAIGLTIKVAVRSPRFRFIYDAPTAVPPRRISDRSDGMTHGTPRVRGGGNTVQAGNRTLGGIL
jgi:hypothetical protein